MIALGLVSEFETQYLLCVRLKFVEKENAVMNCMEDVKKLILGLRNYLKSKM